jgi:hypothetical protein
VRCLVDAAVDDNGCCAREEDADADAEEEEARLRGSEGVGWAGEYEREGGEEEEEDSEGEGSVERDGQDHWLSAEHVEWAEKSAQQDL